jgi:hypothetical protein
MPAQPSASRDPHVRSHGIICGLVDNVDLLLALLAPLMAMATTLSPELPAETPVAALGEHTFTAGQLRSLAELLAER